MRALTLVWALAREGRYARIERSERNTVPAGERQKMSVGYVAVIAQPARTEVLAEDKAHVVDQESMTSEVPKAPQHHDSLPGSDRRRDR